MLFENICSNDLLALLKSLQKDDVYQNYILVGGTSLALQIGHRKSVDIDLFTLDNQDNNLIIDNIEKNYNTIEIVNNSDNVLQVIINNIKVDFVKAIGKLIEKPVCENGLRLCSIEDIAGMKLNTISRETGRRKPKDFIDIAYLIEKLSLDKMFEIYKWKYDKTSVYNVKLDLLEVDKINPYTWQEVEMLDKKIFISDVPHIIKNAIEKYNRENEYTARTFGFGRGKNKNRQSNKKR